MQSSLKKMQSIGYLTSETFSPQIWSPETKRTQAVSLKSLILLEPTDGFEPPTR